MIDPGDLFVEARGSSQTARTIHHLLPPAAEAGRLIAFEVITPGGNWNFTVDPDHAWLSRVGTGS